MADDDANEAVERAAKAQKISADSTESPAEAASSLLGLTDAATGAAMMAGTSTTADPPVAVAEVTSMTTSQAAPSANHGVSDEVIFEVLHAEQLKGKKSRGPGPIQPPEPPPPPEEAAMVAAQAVAKAAAHLAVGRALPNNYRAPRPVPPPGTKGVGPPQGRGGGRGRGRGGGGSSWDAGEELPTATAVHELVSYAVIDDAVQVSEAAPPEATERSEENGAATAASDMHFMQAVDSGAAAVEAEAAAADDLAAAGGEKGEADAAAGEAVAAVAAAVEAASAADAAKAADEASLAAATSTGAAAASTEAAAEPSTEAPAEAPAGPPPERVRAPIEPEQVTLPDGSKCVASMARPFLAMLPLSDQTNAKDGHVLMMPVQLSYPTMATLLARPPLTTPYMTAAAAADLSDAMEALVHSGQASPPLASASLGCILPRPRPPLAASSLGRTSSS